MPQHRQHVRKSLAGAGVSVLDLLAGIALALALSPYVVRSLGDRLYAMMVLAGTLTGWFALLDLGLSAAVSRFVTLHFAQQDWTRLNRVANTAFFLYTGLGAVGFLVAVLVGVVARMGWPGMENVDTFGWVMALYGLAFFVMLPTQAFAGIVAGAMRPELSAARSLAFRLLTAAATFSVLYFGQSPSLLGFGDESVGFRRPALLIGIAAAGAVLKIANAWVFWRTARAVVPSFHIRRADFDRAEAKALFGFSLVAFASQVGDVILLRTDALIVTAVVGLSAVTHYQMGAAGFLDQYIGLMVAATGWMTGMLTLLFARGEDEAMRRGMALAYKGATYVSAFIAFGLIAWAPDFITRWIGPQYLDAYPALVALVAYYGWASCQAPTLRYLYAVARHRLLAGCQLVEGACHLTLSIALGKWCGQWGVQYALLGVALGTLIPGLLGRGLWLQAAVCRLRGVPVVAHYAALGENLLRAGLALLAPYFIAPTVTAWILATTYGVLGRDLPEGPNYPHLVVNALLCAAMYAAALACMGFRRDERRALANLLRRRTVDVSHQP